jgi:hypothetical protein
VALAQCFLADAKIAGGASLVGPSAMGLPTFEYVYALAEIFKQLGISHRCLLALMASGGLMSAS